MTCDVSRKSPFSFNPPINIETGTYWGSCVRFEQCSVCNYDELLPSFGQNINKSWITLSNHFILGQGPNPEQILGTNWECTLNGMPVQLTYSV